MRLNEVIGRKTQVDPYLKQRAFIVDKKRKLLVGIAPEIHLKQYMTEAIGMKWFADYAGKVIVAETLEGLFRKLMDIGVISFVPMIDWPRAEKGAKATVALTSEPYKSIEKFVMVRS